MRPEGTASPSRRRRPRRKGGEGAGRHGELEARPEGREKHKDAPGKSGFTQIIARTGVRSRCRPWFCPLCSQSGAGREAEGTAVTSEDAAAPRASPPPSHTASCCSFCTPPANLFWSNLKKKKTKTPPFGQTIHFFVCFYSPHQNQTAKHSPELCFPERLRSGSDQILAKTSGMSCRQLLLVLWAQSSR